MFGFLKRRKSRVWSVPDGRRVYAVGDVHGCLDALHRLLARIEQDRAARGAAETYIVFLGDLVDRGPDSRGVIEALRTFNVPGLKPVFLMGNHEEFFLRVLEGDASLVSHWLGFGGLELALSYGLGEGWLLNASPEAIVQELAALVPRAHIAFVRGFADSFRVGDYLFVHAGIRPGMALDQQLPKDTRWIREGFLEDRSDHGVMVIHGHTVTAEPDLQANRIGIDTGAYRGGHLTALGLEGRERWFLDDRTN